MTQRNPKEIYTAFINGDTLTDDDLVAGIKHFGDMANLLLKSGPVFHLARVEAFRVADRLKDFKNARNERNSRDRS